MRAQTLLLGTLRPSKLHKRHRELRKSSYRGKRVSFLRCNFALKVIHAQPQSPSLSDESVVQLHVRESILHKSFNRTFTELAGDLFRHELVSVKLNFPCESSHRDYPIFLLVLMHCHLSQITPRVATAGGGEALEAIRERKTPLQTMSARVFSGKAKRCIFLSN